MSRSSLWLGLGLALAVAAPVLAQDATGSGTSTESSRRSPAPPSWSTARTRSSPTRMVSSPRRSTRRAITSSAWLCTATSPWSRR